MEILLLGADGMLGSAVCKKLKPDCQIREQVITEYDLRDADAFIRDLQETRPQAVVNAAAYTAVDNAEKEFELACEINGEAPAKLAGICKERGIDFVHISTDYVFDGNGKEPYKEDHPTAPVNAYGKSKLIGEQKVAAAHPDGHLIIRTSWLYGMNGKNFPDTMLRMYEQGRREFRVVGDQTGRTAYTADLAEVIRACLEKNLHGIYHAANRGQVTWYEFAREIFSQAGLIDKIELTEVTSEEYVTPAKRPGYSVLDTSKLEKDVGIALPDYKDALKRYLAERGVKTAKG